MLAVAAICSPSAAGGLLGVHLGELRAQAAHLLQLLRIAQLVLAGGAGVRGHERGDDALGGEVGVEAEQQVLGRLQRLADVGAAVVGVEHRGDHGQRAACPPRRAHGRPEHALHAARVPIAEGEPAERVDQDDHVLAASARRLAWPMRQLGLADLLARLLLGGGGEDLGLRQRAAPTAGPPPGARRQAPRRGAPRSRRSPRRERAATWSGPSAAGRGRARAARRPSGPSRSTARTSGSSSASGANSRRCGGAARQVLEVPPLLLRALAVHRLDADQRAVALAAARLPGPGRSPRRRGAARSGGSARRRRRRRPPPRCRPLSRRKP